jgi:hypothetical protein
VRKVRKVRKGHPKNLGSYIPIFRTVQSKFGGGGAGAGGHAVAQWIEALRYKPEGRGFDS